MRKKKSLARATRLVTKRLLPDVDSACTGFYRWRYVDTLTQTPQLSQLPPLPEGTLRQVLVSPQGKLKVVVVEKDRRRTLWLCGQGNKKQRCIVSYPLPPWIDDHSSDPYPVVAFDRDQLLVATPRKGKIEVSMYTSDGRFSGRRALSLPDGIDDLRDVGRNDWLIHAWRLGGEAFVHYDPQHDRYQPVEKGKHTDPRNPLGEDVITTGKDEILRFYEWDTVRQLLNMKAVQVCGGSERPWYRERDEAEKRQAAEDSILNAARDTTQSFLSGALGGGKQRSRKDSLADPDRYDPKKVQPYILQLYSAYFSAQVNNDYINRYQPYQNYQGQFKFPEAGAQAKGGFSDLFENHHFSIAYRLPVGSDGSDFFVSYRNTKRRTDWDLTYFRKVEQLSPDPYRNWTGNGGKFYPNTGKVKTHYYEGNLHHPLSWYSAIDFSTAIRYDRTIFVATDLTSLRFEDLKQSRSVNTLSYNIDKRLPTLPGLYFRVDSNAHFKQDAPYVFQTLITPFRGYKQNSLYDDRYGLLNLDVYVPLFAELIDYKTPLPSINNLQIGLFTDIATASENYKGAGKDNKDELLWSLGFSARTILAGYPIRLDIGWPETGEKPVWYLSLKL